uniref:FBA_2 domain-containing protein n=1 Tax=Steinernema glaseri TaxID=37863 RepID=A0A1I7YQP4_9BILA
MDSVPLTFIRSVFRISKHDVLKEFHQFSSPWGREAEAEGRRSGGLRLTFAPYNGDKDDYRLYYALRGFSHVDSTELSRAVAGQISKTIKYIELQQLYIVNEQWNLVNPNDVDLLQLLINLDAPEKLIHCNGALSLYVKLQSKYSNLFRSFTSATVQCYNDSRIIEYMASYPRMRSLDVKSYVKVSWPTSFLLDYFFSDTCMRLFTNFMDLSVILGAIDRWKKMDPRTLKFSKLLYGMHCYEEDLTGVGLKEIDVEAKAALMKKVRSKVKKDSHIKSLHRVDHPIDPSSKIYVVLYYDRRYTDLGEVLLVF